MTKKKEKKSNNSVVSKPAKPTKTGDIVNNIPESVLPQEVRIEHTTMQTSYHEGPIPSPEYLKRYEDACPGAARDILDMAIKQNNHVIDSENKIIDRRFNNLKRGQWFAFGSMLVGGVLGAFAIYHGMPWIATTAFGLPTAAIIGVFVTNKRHKTVENEKKEVKSSDEKAP